MNFWVIFLTGLTVGGLSCAAVQGGLLASAVTTNTSSKLWTTTSFLIAKLIAYSALGFLLGAFGSRLSLSDPVRITMQIVAGVYMIAVAMDLLKVHPIFRYAIISPPKFFYKLAKRESMEKSPFAPLFLGLLTVLIPCGTTLAMETLAISSGNAWLGGLTMAAFTLGTMPLFFGIGLIAGKLEGRLLKLAAVAIIYLGLSSINGALVYANSPITWQNLIASLPIEFDFSGGVSASDTTPLVNGYQTAQIRVYGTGYNPNYLKVKAGIPVNLNLITQGDLGCTSVFRIPSLNITQQLPLNGQTKLAFTPPSPGKLIWTCSMGMYTGTLDVIP